MNTPEEEKPGGIESPNGEQPAASRAITPSGRPDPTQNIESTEDASPAHAQGGGGPRTTEGKEKSRRNALTHGIFAKVLLLDGESGATYDALLQGYRDYFHPVGTVEEVHVEELATLKWRQRRLLQAERAEIQCEVEFNSRAADRAQQQRQEAAVLQVPTIAEKGGLLAERQNPLVLQRALDHLERLEACIKHHGFDPKADHAIIGNVFGQQGKCELRGLYELCRDSSITSGVAEFKEFDLPLDGRIAKFLGYLRDAITEFKRSLTTLNVLAEEREALESESSCVPEPARLDRLLRYGASLQRDYERSLNQLERLQRARKGQPPLPTMNVNVSS